MKTSLRAEEERLVNRLREHPQLRARINRMLAIVDDVGDELREADQAELRVIEEVRNLGRELFESWAQEQVEKRAEELERAPGVKRAGKKNSAGTACSAKSRSRSRCFGKERAAGGR